MQGGGSACQRQPRLFGGVQLGPTNPRQSLDPGRQFTVQPEMTAQHQFGLSAIRQRGVDHHLAAAILRIRQHLRDAPQCCRIIDR